MKESRERERPVYYFTHGQDLSPGTVHQKREDQLRCLNSPQFVSLRNQRLDEEHQTTL